MSILRPSSPLVLSLFASAALLTTACADDGGVGDGGSGSESDSAGTTDDEVGSTDTGDTTDTTTETTDDSSDTSDSTDTTDTGEPGDFEVGVDVRNLDPSDQQLAGLYLGGFGAPFTRGTAEGVHDSLFARSMAVGLGDEAVIFTIVDAVGMGNQWTRQIRQQAADLTGLDPSQIIVATTHSHSGPDFQGLWGGVGDSYRSKVINETVLSMLAAWDTRKPARLSVSSSTAANHNRRDWGFTDDTMFILQAHALGDDQLLGTLVSFAAHPVILGASNKQLSRDYCGYAVDSLEAGTGAPALFFNGILGDVSPSVPDGMYADDFEKAGAYGELVASQALLMLEQAEAVEPILVRQYSEWELPVENVLFNLAGNLGILDYDFMMGANGNVVQTQTVYVRLGTQAQIVAYPGESLTRNGLPVKEAMAAPYKAVLGNSGDALGYFVPSDEWQTGLNDNYEEGVSLGMSVGDTTRDLMIELIDADVF